MRAQNKNKKYRNLISTQLKRSKQSYFTIFFFQENTKELKNAYKGIKNISEKSSNQASPNAIFDNNAILIDPIALTNAFNKYFSTIFTRYPTSIRYQKKFF